MSLSEEAPRGRRPLQFPIAREEREREREFFCRQIDRVSVFRVVVSAKEEEEEEEE